MGPIVSLADSKNELIRQFHKTGSFKYAKEPCFRLSSGRLSNYYVDCKNLMSDPDCLKLVAELAWEELKDLEFDSIGGKEIGAIFLSTRISAYAREQGKFWRTFVVRKEAKKHGLGKKVEGYAEPGARALVLDDVLTTGASVREAVQAAREYGMSVEHVLVIVDREDPEQDLQGMNLKVHSLLSIKDLLGAHDLDTVLK